MDVDINQTRQVSGDSDVVMANKQQQQQKRRAVFGDITNSSTSTVNAGGKKQCTKNVSVLIPDVIDDEVPDTVITIEDDSPSVHTSAIHSKDDSSDVTTESEEMTVDWVDVDKDNTNPSFLSTYVNDIFDHYRRRELNFVVSDYMSRQREMSVSMRAILVDWLVEVQQSFELVHETLYLAVKLTDCYLDRQTTTVAKNLLQLIGSTALNVACKFEERTPPVIDDFLYVCDDAYTKNELLEMEKHILKAVDFDIGIPLSYTFLRRYAQCGRVSTPTLTLARYILETSLMDYSYVSCHESKMAAACLLLAMNMNCDGQWDATVTHYTQYTVGDLIDVTSRLNTMLTASTYKSLKSILVKYSHQVFHEVAKIAPLTEQEMDLVRSCKTSGRSVVRYAQA